MGNNESSQESVPEEEQGKNKNKSDENSKSPQQVRVDEINLAEITYEDIYLEESHESGEGLSDFTEEDSDKDPLQDLTDQPDRFSGISRLRNFTAWLSVAILYSKPKSVLTIRLKGTTNVPGRGQGGANSYQVMVTLFPHGRHSLYSKLRIGPNPFYEDTWDIPLNPADLANSNIRFRLYGCTNEERTDVFGEGRIELSEVNPRIENLFTVKLASMKDELGHANSESDEEQPSEDEARIQGFIGEINHTMNTLAQTPLPKPLNSELLLNAAYSPITGRFECIIQQAHGVRVPGSKSSRPYSFVQVLLRSEDNTILARSKTKICKRLNNPAFNETFFFTVTKPQIETINLVISMYHKMPPGRKINLGGFSMGMMNTSKVEKEHWDEIIRSAGERVARWHKLYTDVL